MRREYISGKPQIKIARFSSGEAKNNYDYRVELAVTEKIQIRHNALEAARLRQIKPWQKQVRLVSFLCSKSFRM